VDEGIEGSRALTERQAARRDRVVRAALALAEAGGYEAVQMRDVATRARVALGTLYRYFSSKDHLLVTCLADWTRAFQRRLAARPPRGATATERVVDVLKRAADALERSPKLMEAFVTALTSLSAADAAGLGEAAEVYRLLHEIVTDAMGEEAPPSRGAVVRVIGEVWLAALIARVRGWAPEGQMAEDLEAAVRLLLPSGDRGERVAARSRA
jgi:AcrR family transcriptional regulator